MKKLVLGFVNQSDAISGMAMVTFFNNFNSLRREILDDSLRLDLLVRVVSDNPHSTFCRFVTLISKNVEILKPSDWSTLNFPPQSNGSFATYWKFDLINCMDPDEILLYLDADALILRKFNINALIDRINGLMRLNSNQGNSGVLMMTPSHRPNLERIGFSDNSNPYCYFNAGVILGSNVPRVTRARLLSSYNDFFFNDPTQLYWHDQDLINTLFSSIIHALPFRYNVSTGMLRREFYGVAQLNYLAEREILSPVVAHASGGILDTAADYPWRESFKKIATDLLEIKTLEVEIKLEIEKFLARINVSGFRRSFQKLFNSLRIKWE